MQLVSVPARKRRSHGTDRTTRRQIIKLLSYIFDYSKHSRICQHGFLKYGQMGKYVGSLCPLTALRRSSPKGRAILNHYPERSSFSRDEILHTTIRFPALQAKFISAPHFLSDRLRHENSRFALFHGEIEEIIAWLHLFTAIRILDA